MFPPFFFPLKKEVILLYDHYFGRGHGLELPNRSSLVTPQMFLLLPYDEIERKPKRVTVIFASRVWFLINVQLKTNSVVEHSSDGITRSRQTDEGFSQGLWQHGHHRLVSIKLYTT